MNEYNFDSWRCKNCGADSSHLYQGVADFACDCCGACDMLVFSQDCYNSDKTEYTNRKDVSVHLVPKTIHSWGRISSKSGKGDAYVSSGFYRKRRYKPISYFKERMQQWLCKEPRTKHSVLLKFEEALQSGNYGRRESLTKGTILWMCRELRLSKYKENWKSILEELSGKCQEKPSSELVDDCISIFKKISKRLGDVSGTLIKGSKSYKRINMLHVNHIILKILHHLGVEDEWTREFSQLKTPSKVECIDNCLEEIFRLLGLSFARSVIVNYPRCKRRKRRVKKIQ